MIDSDTIEFKINYLQYEYRRYSQLFYNEIQHIEDMYKSNLIKTNVRNNYIKTLNELLRYMNNDIYNGKLKELKELRNNNISVNNINETMYNDEHSQDELTENDIHISNTDDNIIINNKNIHDIFNFKVGYNNNIQTLIDICKNDDNDKLNNLVFNDFDKVGEKLLKICSEVGFYSLDDAFNILIGSKYKNYIYNKSVKDNNLKQNSIDNFKELFELYNIVFIPVNYRCEETANDIGYCIKSSMDLSIISPNELYMNSYGELYINLPYKNTTYIFGGYFKNDPIQSIIRTSQIHRNFLYKKKRKFIDYYEKNSLINSKFANLYIKNLPIGELLSYDETEFLNKLNNDYYRYSELAKMNFKSLMDEFTRDMRDTENSLKNMFTIIRLLLLGPDDCINVAGLLFGLTKDKKIGAEIVADIIYKNLCYTMQIKLKKSSINIKNELEKLKNLSETDIDIKKQIACNNNIPQKIKKIIFDKLEEQKFNSSETSKNGTYIDILCNYPWKDGENIFDSLKGNNNKSIEFMDKVSKTLNNRVYGHSECKQVIQEIICKWIMNPKSVGKALGLLGPPGVGKTLIAKGLGEALGIPCCSISLCGVEDPAVLNGHSFTYSAAQPGLIVRKMVEAGKARCILFFDELDKSSYKHGTNEIQNVFINLTDINMNAKFNDKFFQEVTFPLDKVLFVFSYNDRNKIDKILLNRIHEIKVNAYNTIDKLNICQNFLVKEISEDVGLEYKSIQFKDNDVKDIIQKYTHEPGVRELKRKIETIFLKLNVDRIYKRGLFECKCRKKIKKKKCKCKKNKEVNKDCKLCNFKCQNDCKIELNTNKPFIVNKDIITKYLGKPKLDIEKINSISEIGIVNGLYATEIGYGGIIKILIYKNYLGNDNKCSLTMTGSQGKVMKESVNFAFTTAANLIKKEYVDKFLEEYKTGLHIHTPDGATPKDGPSAGGAFTTAFISRILEKKIKNTVAMTGEIGECGDIKIIGGLHYKIRGAKKAGVKTVLIPQDNLKDLEEIKKTDENLIKEGELEVIAVSHISEILKYALIDEDNEDNIFDASKYLKDKYLK
jgi:endopeptidase La